MAHLEEHEIYDKLARHLLTPQQLKGYNYPRLHPAHPGCIIPIDRGLLDTRYKLHPLGNRRNICIRCDKTYEVDNDGMQMVEETCYYHDIWWTASNCYSCCKSPVRSTLGCKSNPYHVQRGALLIPNHEDFLGTEPRCELEPNRHGVFALDTEMCYTPVGFEVTRVSVVNYKQEVVYDKLVKPTRFILDYNTSTSGIKKGDLDNVTTRLHDVQRDLVQLFSSKSILIGHSLEYDLKVLKLAHECIVDTSILYPHRRGPPLKMGLRVLIKEKLGQSIQGDIGHDSIEDARATLRLAYHKVGI